MINQEHRKSIGHGHEDQLHDSPILTFINVTLISHYKEKCHFMIGQLLYLQYLEYLKCVLFFRLRRGEQSTVECLQNQTTALRSHWKAFTETSDFKQLFRVGASLSNCKAH